MFEWETGEKYESSPAGSMIGMAVMEWLGIPALIDSLVGYDGRCILSPGNAVKAMIAPIFDSRKKMPLCGVRHFHRGAPVDLLFGKGVNNESLNDHALARNLDRLFDAGLDRLFWECSSLAKRRLGFDSKILHADATNYTVWAVPREYHEEGAAVPAFGHAKNKRSDLLQYSAMTVTDGDRILNFCKAYSGNAADCVMNAETLEFLGACTDPRENTVIADCKLVNADLIGTLNDMGMGFVSKVPSSFSEKIRDCIAESAALSEMDVSSVEGYRTYDTEAETECGKLRFIAYRSPAGTGKAMDYLERQGKRDAEKLFKPFSNKRFACETDAAAAFGDALKKQGDSAYVVTGETVRVEETARRKTRGRPPKDSPEPETKVSWKVGVTMSFDKKRASELADRRGISVIVTNLPFSSEDTGDVRRGATADTVLRLYLDQYKAEHTYRLMKSGMGVDSVYVRTPSRANALLFVVAVATLISSIMDALTGRNKKGRRKTAKQVLGEIQNAAFKYRRDVGRMSVGPNEFESEVFAFMDVLGLDPSFLLRTSGG